MRVARKTIFASITILAVTPLVAVYFLAKFDPTRACGKQQIGGGPNKCFGTIALREDWDLSYDEIFDSTYQYLIAGIDAEDQYIATENTIYVINKYPCLFEGEYSDGCRISRFQNGQLRSFSYESVQEVPTYLVIDYLTHEVRAYTSIDVVPVSEQHYFVLLDER